ncbi:GatB/YqeY domain-containing protein [Sodiomyces alkalinus F11]|uniref:Altered inheritance of mitochondria protein 41 n=1 Tax=Sodiomyces alkalinus (strain CBS 110278 / VKM F-3762 / F11) TaxID=1314773 RepID=A0A3N2PVV7_SODAK|nr:GatB/YqeY domain-containing protein [Sodiomyces alkalinus F11]ROT38631.1 GatB/YqeY domain-containing protein [Sodiomyces alkalinus F11]
MASRQATHWLRALRPLRIQPWRSYHPTPQLFSVAASSSAPATPPLLATLKSDLKTAMRSKDAQRLTVLRAVLSATNNAAKTSSPVTTNLDLVALLRKSLRGSREASAQARDADRPDLAEKEDAQARILEEYIAASGVETVSEAQVRDLVRAAIEEARAAGAEGKQVVGRVMKAVTRALKGRDVEVDAKEISKLVSQALQA